MGSKNTKLMVKEAIKDIKYIMEHSKNVKIEPMIMARKEAEERLRMVKFNTMRMKQMRQAQAVSSQEKAKSVEDIRKAYEDQRKKVEQQFKLPKDYKQALRGDR